MEYSDNVMRADQEFDGVVVLSGGPFHLVHAAECGGVLCVLREE